VKAIYFSKNYVKLHHNIFTTIRRYDRYDYGTYRVVVNCNGKKWEFEAVLLLKFKAYLSELSTAFLCYDTGAKTREEAIELLNSFYKKPIKQDEELTVLLFKKIIDTSKWF